MSREYPIIALTGSSGAGTTTIKDAFARMFGNQGLIAAFVHGDSFHRYTRMELDALLSSQPEREETLSHFAVEANLLDRLEALFQEYSQQGTGTYRHYIHAEDKELVEQGHQVGTFTPWESLPESTDLLLYEGLHGGLVTEDINIAQYVDLLIGVAPSINLEWIQKIDRDTKLRGYSQEAVINTIQARMEDYMRLILPQFSRTHINFQRVPVVDTANPFEPQSVPTADESLVVINFRENQKVDFPYLLSMIQDSFMSRPRTLVIPGPKLPLAMELIMQPRVQELLDGRRFK
ncbi:phosphoribulokinase [Marinospirillum celere]|uniref:Phosphoribulokinase n=1 Tax=Marinospirillum celere TaxID=1122252 RepID=A0A1I1FIZ7_9GAMM|nr:phosphoribulokinase [Marinospirillum celere]SFB99315.1 phosphoribulokinase [Marinospirillum celere]